MLFNIDVLSLTWKVGEELIVGSVEVSFLVETLEKDFEFYQGLC